MINEWFCKCTKISLWFSGSVDFISSGAIVYGVIDDFYQLVIRYFRENKKSIWSLASSFMQHNMICKFILKKLTLPLWSRFYV